MTMDSQAIESIVRRVLSRMLASDALRSSASIVTPPAMNSTVLRLSDKIITLASLPKDLTAIRELSIAKRAVVTPAVHDLLRSAKISIVRSASTSEARETPATASSLATPTASPQLPSLKLPSLIVAGTGPTMAAVKKAVCPRQALVLQRALDDDSALRAAAAGIRSGHRAAVVIANSAHAIAWQAGRDDQLRPAVLAQWSQLGEVLAEVPANMLILSSKYWNAPATINACRAYYKHLNQS